MFGVSSIPLFIALWDADLGSSWMEVNLHIFIYITL